MNNYFIINLSLIRVVPMVTVPQNVDKLLVLESGHQEIKQTR